ncbi:MAG: hypothetical protein JRN68_06530 [Nitrososphaerota archaeon]|nr:hypothetical protein [Nitrososphaerota archaeon]
MSMQRAHLVRKIEESLVVIGITLLAPLIISFIVYLVASAAGASGPGLPAVGYGINAVTSITSSGSTPAFTSTSGVSVLWLTLPKGATAWVIGPQFPTILLNLINDILMFISIFIALVVAAIRFAPSLIEFEGE